MSYYTKEEIAAFAAAQGCSIKEFQKRWIIANSGSYFVHGRKGYLSPIKMSDLEIAIQEDLSRVPPEKDSEAGINWDISVGTGEKEKPAKQIAKEYGSVAREIVANLYLQTSYFDKTEHTFHEAACPLADVEPRRHEDVEEWLRLFAGEKHEKLLDWIATLTMLEMPTCGLIITGKPGVGKEMLAQGLARRWKRAKTPTELARILKDFNEDLTRCPLVFCDEVLPTGSNGKRVTLLDLRNPVASSSRTLARKHISNANLVGAIRLILAANNYNMMANFEDMTPDDQKAVAERFLHIEVGPAAAEYLEKIGGRKTTEAWVAGNKIAEHCLYLEKTRYVNFDSRYIVRGDAIDIQSKLVLSNKNTSLILEWISRFLMAGDTSTQQLLVGNGEILINTTAVTSSWGKYIESDFVPSTTRVGTALRNLAADEKRIAWYAGPDKKPNEIRYHVIKTHLVYEWARQNQVGDPEAMEQRVKEPLDVEALKKMIATKSFSGGLNITIATSAEQKNGDANGHANGHTNGNGHIRVTDSDQLGVSLFDQLGFSLK